MVEKGKLEWVDAGGKEIPNGAQVALLAKVVGRHGGGRVSIEPLAGQRIIIPGSMCDQAKAVGKQALREVNAALGEAQKEARASKEGFNSACPERDVAQALVGAREKDLVACGKEKESLKQQLAREQTKFDDYVKGQGTATKRG